MRYYFHLVSSQEVIRDTTGVEIPDPARAQRLAHQIISEVQLEADQIKQDRQGWRIDVVDPFGNVILSIPLDAMPQS